MRTPSPTLSEALFGAYRQRVLAMLLSRPDETFHIRELARRTGVPPGSLHRELKLLAQIELLQRESVGNQIFYRANTASPVFEELASLFMKTAGVAATVQQALAPLGKRVTLAFVFGSFARKEERARSDVDLFVIGTASFVDVVKALAKAAATLAREINPVVMTAAAFRGKIADGDSFLKRLLPDRKVFVKGTEDDFGKFVKDAPSRRARTQRRGNRAAAQGRSA